jgi:hypothetical protein
MKLPYRDELRFASTVLAMLSTKDEAIDSLKSASPALILKIHAGCK